MLPGIERGKSELASAFKDLHYGTGCAVLELVICFTQGMCSLRAGPSLDPLCLLQSAQL